MVRVEILTKHFYVLKKKNTGNSLVVQRLVLHAFIAKGLGLIPGQRTKIPQVSQCDHKQTNKIKCLFIFLKNQQPSYEAIYSLY